MSSNPTSKPLVVQCTDELFGVLQCLTEAFNPDNADHVKQKQDVELGNGLPGIRTTTEVDNAVKAAGLEVCSRLVCCISQSCESKKPVVDGPKEHLLQRYSLHVTMKSCFSSRCLRTLIVSYYARLHLSACIILVVIPVWESHR